MILLTFLLLMVFGCQSDPKDGSNPVNVKSSLSSPSDAVVQPSEAGNHASPVPEPAPSNLKLEMNNSACPKYRNDLRNSGMSTGVCPENPKIIWAYKTGGSIARPPSVDNKNNLYFGGNDSFFYCLDPKGKLKWKTKLDEWVDSTPVITDRGTSIVGCDDGNLLAISPEGKILWKYYMHAEISSSPVIFNNLVFAGSEDGFLYGINSSGEVVSKFRAKNRILASSPAVSAEGNIITGAEDNNIYALKPDGSVVWTYKDENKEVFVSPPVIDHTGKIIFSSPDNKIVCLDKTGKLLWKTILHEEIVSPMAVDSSNIIYGVTVDGVLMSLSNSGKILWKTKVPEKEINGGLCLSANSKIILTGEKVYIYNNKGRLEKTIDKTAGKLTEPVLSQNGSICAGSSNGYMYCIGGKK
jgi:outer membrane protein assembly factor BamB